MTELISKIGGTILVVGMILAVRKSETYLAKSLRFSRDGHEIDKTENSSEKLNNSKVSEKPTGSEKPNNSKERSSE